MLRTKQLENNPSLYVFLPLFYTVWYDAVLTPSEISAIEGLIQDQAWLTEDERKFLLSQIDPASPPSPDELIRWREEISKAVTSPDQKSGLIDLGIKLATINGNGKVSDTVTKAKSSLINIEAALGLISHEAVFAFQSVGRKTITSEQTTQKTFDVDAMAKLLDGANAETIRKVKTIISDPEFKYIDPGNLDAYREKVLKWCHLLADQGFGSIAYPKEFGGKGDMAAYFAIMEALSYHDLSLVIKFGVQFGLWGMSVYFLGTEKHHKKYLKDIGTL